MAPGDVFLSTPRLSTPRLSTLRLSCLSTPHTPTPPSPAAQSRAQIQIPKSKTAASIFQKIQIPFSQPSPLCSKAPSARPHPPTPPVPSYSLLKSNKHFYPAFTGRSAWLLRYLTTRRLRVRR